MKEAYLQAHISEHGVIINAKGEVLLLCLPKSAHYPTEAWMLPGGRLEQNDQPVEGLQREILEETGLKVDILTPCHTAKWGEPVKYVVFYLCKMEGEQRVHLSSEHTAYKWIPLEKATQVPFHNEQSLLAIKKAHQMINEKEK